MITKLVRLIGGHDFRNAAFNQLWKLFSGPLILVLIPLFLTVEEQGFWFTFTSLAALVIFADMGFSTILLQFSAHEFANLHFDANKKIQGLDHSKFKLASLWRFSLRWATMMSVLVFPVIVVIGFFLFNDKPTEVDWLVPWLIYGGVSTLVFINSVSLAFFEGCDSVGDIQQLRLKISVANVSVTVMALALGGGLYSLVIGLFFSAVFGFFSIRKKYHPAIAQFSSIDSSHDYPWKNEVFPLLGKYSISWISGYFIFQAFTPIAFYSYGAEASGKIGLGLAIVMAIFGISNVWMVIITPKVNIYIARQRYAELDAMFWRSLNASGVTFAFGIVIFYLLTYLLKGYLPVEERLPSPIFMTLLALGWFAQIYVNGMAIYVRAHKQEPLMWFSVLMGLYILLTTLSLAALFPVDYFLIGFLTSYLWGVPMVVGVFKKFRQR